MSQALPLMRYGSKNSFNQRFSWMWDKNNHSLKSLLCEPLKAKEMKSTLVPLFCAAAHTIALLAQLSSRQFWSCSCEFSTKRLTSPNRCCHGATPTHGWAQCVATPCDGEGYLFSCWSAQLVQIPVLQADPQLQRTWECVLLLCELTGWATSPPPPNNTLPAVLYLSELSGGPVIWVRFVPISTFIHPFCHHTK